MAVMLFHGASAAVYWQSHQLLFLNTEYIRFHARWTYKVKVIPSPTWQRQRKMKLIEFFHTQSQQAVTWRNTLAPHVSKQGRNAPRPRARCTLSFHSHVAMNKHVGNGSPLVCP